MGGMMSRNRSNSRSHEAKTSTSQRFNENQIVINMKKCIIHSLEQTYPLNIAKYTQAKSATEEVWDAVTKAVMEVAKSGSGENEENITQYAVKEVMNLAKAAAEAAATKLDANRAREAHTRAFAKRNSRAGDSDDVEAALHNLLFLEIARALVGGLEGESRPAKFKSLKRVNDKAIVHPWTKKTDLGKGAFGSVYSAVDKVGFEFAVKQVSRRGVEEASIREEVRFLNNLSHRNIVKCYGCAGDEEYIYMYMELMTGSIDDEMQKQGKPPGARLAQKYTKDLLQGLIYLHSKGVVHRDIKCANVLLDSDGNAKLADMGISKKHEQETLPQYEHRAGTLFWMSPEAIESKETGKRSDVWAVGCTVYEMVTGYPPFMEKLMDQPLLIPLLLPKFIMEFKHKKLVAADESLGPKLQHFLDLIFVKMEDRPFADQLADHPWVR